jgi:hypothetical protein
MKSAEAIILCRMPFLTQPSPFPGLGLAPPMAPITVEAGDKYKTSICRRYLSLASWGEPWWNPCHSLIFDYLSISTEGKTANLGYPGKPWM